LCDPFFMPLSNKNYISGTKIQVSAISTNINI
jgi:hypothetical protein